MNRKNVVITGANGYLGKIIKTHLNKTGFNCIELVREPKNENSHAFILGEDVNERIFLNADWLIHTAYDFSANRSWRDTSVTNVNGSIKLFDAALKNGVKIIFISSISSFENCRSNYGKSKYILEQYLVKKKLENYILRPGLIHGEQIGGIAKSITQLAKFPILLLPGAKQKGYLVNYIHILNLINLIVKGDKTQFSNKPVIAADPMPYTLSEVLKKFGARIIIPFPWRIAWLILKFFEIIGIKLRMGSDGLVSLMNQQMNLDLTTNSYDYP